MDAEPCDGGLPGSDGMPGAEEEDCEPGSDGIDEEEEEDEDELGSDGIDEEEDDDEELGIEGADGADEDDDEELGIDGMPPLLELCCVDSQADRISASVEAPIKATARTERR